jgi:hypothetical protein
MTVDAALDWQRNQNLYGSAVTTPSGSVGDVHFYLLAANFDAVRKGIACSASLVCLTSKGHTSP